MRVLRRATVGVKQKHLKTCQIRYTDMILWAPEARRNTSCLVVATLRIALEVKSRVVLVNPRKAEPYVNSSGLRVINGVITSPSEQLHVFIPLISPVPPTILICYLLTGIDVFKCDQHPLVSPIQGVNTEVQPCIPVASRKTIIGIRNGTP